MGKGESVEIKLYEILGVRVFQKMVFKLEQVIHHRDGGKNENYHFNTKSKTPKRHIYNGFIKFLFFNGSIHLRNLFYLFLYFLIKHIVWGFSWFDVVFFILGIKDFYCVILQRYNYLRIRSIQKLLDLKYNQTIQKLKKQVNNNFQNASCVDYSEELDLIRRIREEKNTTGVVVLKESDIAALKSLSKLFSKNEETGNLDA